MQTRDQKFAMASYTVLEKRIREKKVDLKEYKSFAKRFPTLIHTCGLMQALAFAQTKNEAVLDDFVEILKGDQANPEGFINQCRDSKIASYMQMSREAMFAAGWLKRQADALILD